MSEDMNAFIGELENLTDAPLPKEEAEVKVETPVDETESEPVVEDKVEEEVAEESPPPAEEPVEEEVDPPQDIDPKTAKALEIRQREEKRAKAAHAQRMAELKDVETEVRQAAREVQAEKQKLDELRKVGKTDPVRFMREFLGLSPDDYDYVARQFYYLSKEADKNPKLRELAEQQRRSRENDDRLNSAMNRIQELEQSLSQREEAAQRQQAIDKYLDGVTKAVSDKHPVIKQWLAKAPEKAKSKMYEVADRLANELGTVPDTEDVLEALETERRQELEETGVDVESLFKPKTPLPDSAEKKKRQTLSSDMTTPKTPKPKPKSRDEEFDDVRLALERGVLE